MTTSELGTFLERYFDDPQLANDAFVAAGREAHFRSVDAKAGSRLSMNHAYGATCWLALHDEVINYVGPAFDGADVVRVAGAPYSLLVKDGVAILAVKALETRSRDGRKRVRSSSLRTSLTSVNIDDPNVATLFDADQRPDLAEGLDDALEEMANSFKTVADIAETLVIAAFECDPASGLRSVEVGIGTVDEQGHLNFTDSQVLDVTNETLEYAPPTVVEGDKYHDAPIPKPALSFVDSDVEVVGGDGHGVEK